MSEPGPYRQQNSPEARAALYRYVRSELAGVGTADEQAIRQLALAAVRHGAGEGVHFLLRGPAGSGKTRLVRELANILGLPFSEIPVPMLAQQNWSGADLGDFLLQLLREVLVQHDPTDALAVAQRAVLLIDNLDHLRSPGSYGTSNTREHREGQQTSILTLLSGAPVPVGTERPDGGWIWRGGHALILLAGRLDELPETLLTAEDLESWGLIPPLAQRIAAMPSVLLSQSVLQSLDLEYRLATVTALRRYRALGYDFSLAPTVRTYVEQRLHRISYTPQPGEIRAWIGLAADRALARMLDEVVSPGTEYVLAPDDLSLPSAPKGLWRE